MSFYGTVRARCAVCGGIFIFIPPMAWHWHGTKPETRCTGQLVKVKPETRCTGQLVKVKK